MASRGPGFVGIGMQKAGTRWLHDQLQSHPELWLPLGKELHFFDRGFEPPNLLLGLRRLGRALSDEERADEHDRALWREWLTTQRSVALWRSGGSPVSVDALLGVASGLMVGAAAGAAIALVSHVLIPDRQDALSAQAETGDSPETPQTPDLASARHSAMRSLAVVFPILLWFLLSGGSAGNLAVMIKVSAMGQEVSRQSTRDAARSLVMSTLIGGLAAVLAWQILSIWPSLTVYVLLVALAGLFFGQWIFSGSGLHDDAGTWTYAFLTMIVVLAPAVLDSDFGTAAGARFYDRLFMFIGATLYAVAAVFVFDAFWGRPRDGDS